MTKENLLPKSVRDYTFDDQKGSKGRDEFKRRPIAENVIKMLESATVDISPLMIDAQWGCGKTEFCHKTINLISRKSEDSKY